LKSTPERIAEFKERYQAAGNPFNMSPKYWLSVAFNDDLPDALPLEQVQRSYTLVLASLPKNNASIWAAQVVKPARSRTRRGRGWRISTEKPVK
jgi:predicted DNA-binding protein (MmcQ/YjbR family)